MTQHAHALTGADLRAHTALHGGCVALMRDQIRHLQFSGAKAADALTGLVTNNVLALSTGEGQYAAALTAKGRMVADMRIVRTAEDSFLTSTSAPAWPGWHDIVRKYVNPRLARHAERPLHTLTLAGPDAARALQQLLERLNLGLSPQPVAELRPYSALTLMTAELDWYLIATPELGDIPAFDLLLPGDLLSVVSDAVAQEPTIVPGTDAAWETARVEAGRPLFGPDMNDTTIPQEANLGELGALSFDKGCYTGQETVARVHFRGHVNRHLRLLSSSTPLPAGAQLLALDGKIVGDVRSSVISPKLGALAIAMVRRELGPGDQVLFNDTVSPPAKVEILR